MLERLPISRARFHFLAMTAALAVGLGSPPAAAAQDFEFDAVAAEHLLNRAGFGARTSEVEAAVARGLEATVGRLFAPAARARDPYFVEHPSYRNMAGDRRKAQLSTMVGRDVDELAEDERSDLIKDWRRKARRADGRQMAEYTEWWLDGVVAGENPLRDRMTLFWMGHFTSSQDDVRDSTEMIAQHQFLRTNALGSFEVLLHGIARDPAMLEYLDNDENLAESPNENFARELLELFTLGEGSYTENDVVEAARAFTGWTDRRGAFRNRRGKHDRDRKTFLGVTGRLDGDDVLKILLDEPQTARHLCGQLIAFLEGAEPQAARVERYADLLRANDMELEPVLRALLVDEDFYRAEVVSNRIAGPVDLLCGHARRIGVTPPGRLVAAGTRLLGQHLFFPPNVKGWEGNESWITTSSFMQRGNLAGVMLGVVALGDLLEDPTLADEYESEMNSMAPSMGGAPMAERFADLKPDRALRDLTRTEQLGWVPRYYLAARLDRARARSDADVVDQLFEELLAISVGSATRAEVLDLFASQRMALDLGEDAWLESGPDAEHLLRRTAHVILSLPEAQLH